MRLLQKLINEIVNDADGYIAALDKRLRSLCRGAIVTESTVRATKHIFKYTFVTEELFNALYKNDPINRKRFGDLSVDKDKLTGNERKGY